MSVIKTPIYSSPKDQTHPERTYLFTAKSLSEGHPDKLADRISDTVLVRFLQDDPAAKVGCECLVTDQFIIFAGEGSTTLWYLSPCFSNIEPAIPDFFSYIPKNKLTLMSYHNL